MKKSLAMLMTLLFVLLGTTAWAQSYTAGVYTAQANGNNGPVTVEVEVSDAEILSVKVTEHAETAGLSDTPIERIPAKIVEGQTLAVDTVSGATNTSNAILKAAEDALAQAGADIEALKAVQERMKQRVKRPSAMFRRWSSARAAPAWRLPSPFRSRELKRSSWTRWPMRAAQLR